MSIFNKIVGDVSGASDVAKLIHQKDFGTEDSMRFVSTGN
jgi:hypothetical protein